LPAAGGHGADLGQLPVSLLLHGVGRFPFGRHLAGVLGEFLGGEVAALGGGPGQDLIGGSSGRGPLPSQVVKQRHGVVPRLAAAAAGGGHGLTP